MPEGQTNETEGSAKKKKYSRRDFLVTGGTVVAVDALLSSPNAAAAATTAASDPVTRVLYPESKGYIVYDSKKCAGCTTCMLSCSLVHEGVHSLTLARLQIMQDSFGKFPYDIKMAPCRQCVTPVCVQNCPTGAAFIDTDNGNIRRIDAAQCNGCKTCIASCPQQPHRPVWNHVTRKAIKCDLCIDSPYWSVKGGPDGKQACVESCPMKALKFVAQTPDQTETEGYDVNLRNDHWLNLGLVDNSTVVPPLFAAQASRPAPRRRRE